MRKQVKDFLRKSSTNYNRYCADAQAGQQKSKYMMTPPPVNAKIDTGAIRIIRRGV